MTQRSADDGAIAILVALMSVVLFGFAALVVDIGDAQTVRAQSQNAVDAAALAGVRVLATTGKTPSDAADAVKSYVKDNIGVSDWDGCTDPTPLPVLADSDTADKCISTSPPISPGMPSYQVRVKLPARHVPATFGGIFGVSSISISPIAQALSGQPQPSECGPCDPAIDESTTQPTPQPPPTGLPAAIRAMLPDPGLPPGDPNAVPPGVLGNNGCPGPGLYQGSSEDVVVLPGTCVLNPGLYVFDDANLDVSLGASISSYFSDGNAGHPPLNTGVTLVFYGSGTLSVEGHIGTIDEKDETKRDPLVASNPDVVWQTGQPIPGVAILIDQCDQCGQSGGPDRRFSLGDGFHISGSVYALDGHATWTATDFDCMPRQPDLTACGDTDLPGGQSVIATTATDFTPDNNGVRRIPTVATDHSMAVPPPSPPHLVK